MDRRAFLVSSLLVPFALESTRSVFSATTYAPSDTKSTVNFAADPSNPVATMWQIPTQHGAQMMGYIFHMANGQTVVFDGGRNEEAAYIVDLVQKECGGKVDGWFLTHAHDDHVGALTEILTTGLREQIQIDALYYNFPPHEWLNEHEAYCANATARFYDLFKGFSGTKTVLPGQVFEFGALKIECLNDFDTTLTNNAINNSSITFRLDVGSHSILMLGDLGYEGGDRLLKLQPVEKLQCDFCQMAHHGQQGVRRSFYDVVRPTYTLWPTPEWLWRNNAGQGEGTGPFKTCDTRCWCAELDVKEYYVSKDGLIKFTF